jgi:hypothetical protein
LKKIQLTKSVLQRQRDKNALSRAITAAPISVVFLQLVAEKKTPKMVQL